VGSGGGRPKQQITSMPQASCTHFQRPQPRVTQLGRRLEHSHAPCSHTRTQRRTGKEKQGGLRRVRVQAIALVSRSATAPTCPLLPSPYCTLRNSPSHAPSCWASKCCWGVGVSGPSYSMPVASSCADRPPTLVLHDKWPGPSLFPQLNHASPRSLESSSWCSVLPPKQSLRM
jgi:hypothetical protein